MVNYCIAFGCKTKETPESREQGITFHRLPTEPNLRDAWVRAIRRKDWTPRDQHRLCSQHFKTSNFKPNLKRRYLSEDAVPTVFPGFPTYLQVSEVKQRRILMREQVEVPSDTIRQTPPRNVAKLDHNYSYPDNIEELRSKCNSLRKIVEENLPEKANLKQRLSRTIATKTELKDVLSELREAKLLSHDAIGDLRQFEGVEFKRSLLRQLVNKRGKTSAYSSELKDFAMTLFYHSPKAYEFVRGFLSLPALSTLRNIICTVKCMPGFQQEAFYELQCHRDDQNYNNASLVVDGMSLKELAEYDPHIGRTFGLIDYGGIQDLGNNDTKANEVLVCMLVGYKKYWKLPVAYFFVRGTSSGLLAGIIRECLLKAMDAGVKVWSVTMDGTNHNISAFASLGATLQPKNIEELCTAFPHPHPDADFNVSAILDPPHMIKLIRNTLADYKLFKWPGHGTVKWEHISNLHKLQQEHGFRLGNKLTERHISFHRNKMKVCLAVQSVASKSVADGLRWAHENQIKGFTETDVIATANFLERQDKIFDILNSKSPSAPFHKAALSSKNIQEIIGICHLVEDMYFHLTDATGVPLLKSRRKCGFLGILACIQSIKRLFSYMQAGKLELSFLSTYKLCQDFIEIFFCAIRMRNGFSYNPSPRQFRTAFRQLLVHAGKNVLGSMAANCIQQDETAILSIENTLTIYIQDVNTDEVENNQKIESQDLPSHYCKVQNCKICSSTIAYIAGYYTRSIQALVKCSVCRRALFHSDEDPCPQRSLILMKNYFGRDSNSGLFYPSGSLCSLLYHAETVFRRNKMFTLQSDGVEQLIYHAILSLDINIFKDLQLGHCLETAMGTENHYNCLIHLVLKKYMQLRIKKLLKDDSVTNMLKGNYIHRTRIFQNV